VCVAARPSGRLGPGTDVAGRRGGYRLDPSETTNEDPDTNATVPISFSSPSAFAVAEMPRSSVLEYERRVRFLLVSGRQDDGLWGPIGALWLSDDGARGGFLVNPYAL